MVVLLFIILSKKKLEQREVMTKDKEWERRWWLQNDMRWRDDISDARQSDEREADWSYEGYTTLASINNLHSVKWSQHPNMT